jgi:PAS domain S-box-containing protein
MTHNDLSAQEIVDALHSHLAVLDRDGNITHVNEAWVRFSEERGALPSSTGVGVNYFAVCRARGATPEVEEMLAGIRDVINEAIPQFRAEYTCNTPKETYWYELMVKPLPKPHRGAVVYHTDITELKKAREEYAVILNGARGILWRAKLPGFQTIFTSKHVETILGYSVQAWTTQADLWINRIHPEDREWVLAFTARATEEGRSHDFEYRMISADGQMVWLRNIVNVVVENGRPKEVVGISVDITERKRAQEALSGIARKLVEAQEQERARIGRELHDDINQRLAMLAVELEQLQHNPSEVHTRLQEVRQQATELSNDVQALSHDLHSSKLEYLGVVAGIKSWCKEFTERQKIEVEFTSDVSSTLPSDIGLCLFRVLQEAMHNAVKYSGVKRVQVQLREDSGEIHLIVSDSGCGFDVEGALQGKGLGLTSMRERVRLVNGTISIESERMRGTTIHVRLPLRSKGSSQRAAG